MTVSHVNSKPARLFLFLAGLLHRLSFLAVLAPKIILCVSEVGAHAQEQVRGVVVDEQKDGAGGVLLVTEGGDDELDVPMSHSEALVMDDGTVVLPDEPPENTDQQVHRQQKQQQQRERTLSIFPMTLAESFPYLGSPPQASDVASFRPLGGGRFDEYKSGDLPYLISPDLQQKSDDLARVRRSFIVDAMKHAWSGYKMFAFGHDELLPVSRKGTDPWGGMGTTLVDSLDTLWLMGLKDEFYEGRDWVRDVSCSCCFLCV